MIIYAVADIHGKQKYLDKIRLNIKTFNPDILIIAGDITNYFIRNNLISFIGSLDIPVLFIRGNSDFKSLESRLGHSCRNTVHLEQSPWQYEGIIFHGLDGTVPLPFASRICFPEKKALEMLGDHVKQNSIVVVHPPPRGVLDKVAGRFRAGSHNLARFLKTWQPMLLICGHIHEQPGFEKFFHTTVVNCSMNRYHSGAVIKLENQKLKEIFMIDNQAAGLDAF